MQIYLEDEQGFFKENRSIYLRACEVIEQCIEEERVPYKNIEISLTVVDKEEIQAINREYRGIDKPTDVLSFPQIDPVSKGQIDWDSLDFKELVMLGDIILCSDRAIRQAEEYGHSLEREVCFLIAHSMLHLLGYDHMNDEDEKVMCDKQETILNRLNLSR